MSSHVPLCSIDRTKTVPFHPPGPAYDAHLSLRSAIVVMLNKEEMRTHKHKNSQNMIADCQAKGKALLMLINTIPCP